MAIITFYPLVFQVWMSFTDFGPKNFRVNNPIAAQLRRASTTTSGSPVASSRSRTSSSSACVLFNLWWAFSNVVIHVILGVLIAVLLNIKGLWFRGIYRALFILPVVMPSIIVATVWRNMFDTDAGAVNYLIQGVGTALGFPADAGWMQPQLAAPGRGPDPVHPAAARLLRDDHGEHLAGLAAQRGRRDRRAAEHPRRPVRGGGDGRRERAGRSSGP